MNHYSVKRLFWTFCVFFFISPCCLLSQEIANALQRAKDSLYQNPQITEQICLNLIEKLSSDDEEQLNDYLSAMILLGHAYDLQGDFDTGIQVFYDALEVCPHHDLNNLAIINLRLGSLYSCLKDLGKSVEFVDKATSIYKTLDDSLGVARCYNMRGLIHNLLDENKTAEHFFMQALNINRLYGNEQTVATVLNNLALYDDNPQEKIKLLEEAIGINRKYNEVWSLAENYNNLGVQYFFASNYRMALSSLDKAMNYAQDANAKEIISDNYKYQAWVYDSLSRYDKAYECFLKAYEIEQRIQSEKNLRIIERSIAKTHLLKKNAKIELMEEKHRSDFLLKAIVVSLLLFIVILLVLFILYKKYKERKNKELYSANLALEKSNAENLMLRLDQEAMEKEQMEIQLGNSKRNLINLSYYIRSRTDMLTKIKEQIKDGYKMDVNQIPTHLRKINAFITQYETSDDNKHVFMNEVEQYSEDFIKKLQLKHPGLTKSELQLAAYLRMDLTTKDICLMTGANVKAVNMARYRLRKHLSIASEESISAYLQEI